MRGKFIMHTTTKEFNPQEHNGTCLNVPEFRRLNYFYGQMLSAQDFQIEQNFFREKMKLHNRCLHGYGTVCGLLVEPVTTPNDCPEEGDEIEKELRARLKELLEDRKKLADAQASGASSAQAQAASASPTPADSSQAKPAQGDAKEDAAAELDAKIAAAQQELDDFYKKHCKKEKRTLIRINPGLAIDCKGNELVLRHPVTVDLVERLSNEDYKRIKKCICDLYISLCYSEVPIDPVRPVLPIACGAVSDCEFSRTQDSLCIEVTTTPPEHDHRCETCCECCSEACLLIAKIECFIPGELLHERQIHNGVRRPLSTYEPTTIRGISWKHGHTYTQEQAKRVLGTDHDEGDSPRGLEIRFSRPVRASTIHRGVLDIWVIEGGRGRAGEIYHKSGEFVHKPKDGYVDRIYYRDTTRETLEPGDRVLIIFRADFVLDRCCYPVDGKHVGGKVPLLPEYERHHREHEQHEEEEDERLHHEEREHECCTPPWRPGPWTSGNRAPGGTFESWFFVREDEKEYRKFR
jgi:hypothetical protein